MKSIVEKVNAVLEKKNRKLVMSSTQTERAECGEYYLVDTTHAGNTVVAQHLELQDFVSRMRSVELHGLLTVPEMAHLQRLKEAQGLIDSLVYG